MGWVIKILTSRRNRAIPGRNEFPVTRGFKQRLDSRSRAYRDGLSKQVRRGGGGRERSGTRMDRIGIVLQVWIPILLFTNFVTWGISLRLKSVIG